MVYIGALLENSHLFEWKILKRDDEKKEQICPGFYTVA